MTAPFYTDDAVTLYLGDSCEVLRSLPDASVDAVCCDPPYELAFMGRTWDASGVAFDPAVWAEVLRVLKPGGHLVAFGGTRTYHRLAVAIEDAGFEIRDSLHWIYGSGFPKSLDVGKAIDKAAVATPLWDEIRAHLRHWRDCRGMTNTQLNKAVGGAVNGGGRASAWLSEDQRKPELPSKAQWLRLREVLCWDPSPLDDVYDRVKDGAERPVLGERATVRNGGSWADQERAGMFRQGGVAFTVTAPATEDAARWSGWGTALKPSHEPVVLARKPLSGTVAQTVLAHGTGALNIDACRIEANGRPERTAEFNGYKGDTYGSSRNTGRSTGTTDLGRWPTNVLYSHPPLLDEHGQVIGDACADGCVEGCPVAELDRQSVGKRASKPARGGSAGRPGAVYNQAKGSEPIDYGDGGSASRFFPVFRYEAKAPAHERPRLPDGTAWPTVKPLALMRWLARLVTPPGGLILDPFCGSGTTGEAAAIEGFRAVLIDQDAIAVELTKARLSKPIAPVLDFFEGEIA